MRSVGDDLRAESLRRALALTPDERIALAFRLGDEDLALLCAARGLTPEEGKAFIRRVRQTGRRQSVA